MQSSGRRAVPAQQTPEQETDQDARREIHDQLPLCVIHS